jgi:hypothetical protein
MGRDSSYSWIKIYILGERAHRHVSRGSDGQKGSMRDMTLVLHHIVATNSKGGDFLLIGLIVIDLNS